MFDLDRHQIPSFSFILGGDDSIYHIVIVIEKTCVPRRHLCQFHAVTQIILQSNPIESPTTTQRLDDFNGRLFWTSSKLRLGGRFCSGLVAMDVGILGIAFMVITAFVTTNRMITSSRDSARTVACTPANTNRRHA